MTRILLALLLLLGAEGAALACSCVPSPRGQAEAREMAERIAARATALVEVDVLSAYDPRRQSGELMHVRRTLAGRAPQRFRIARDRVPSSAACDVEYHPGGPAVVLLYPADRPSESRECEFREGGLCTQLLVKDPAFRQLLVEALNRRGARL